MKNDGASGHTPGSNDTPGEQPLKTSAFQRKSQGLQNLQARYQRGAAGTADILSGKWDDGMIRRRFTPATLLPTFPSKIPAVSQSVRCKWYSMCNTCHSRLYPALPPTSVSQRMRELRAILDTTHGPCACRLVGPGTCWPERAGPRKQRTRPCPLGSNRAGGRAPARGLPPAPSLASGPGTRSTTAPRRRAEPTAAQRTLVPI